MTVSKDFILNIKNPARTPEVPHHSCLIPGDPPFHYGVDVMMALVLLKHLAFRGISLIQERINTLLL